jgi:hypothetical protein
MLLQIITISILLFIVYEDFRHRLVRVLFYILVLALLVFQQADQKVLQVLIVQWIFNLGYLTTIALIATLYFYVKTRTFSVLKSIGIGDVVFMAILACWFEPIDFIFFITLSCLFAFALHLLFRKTRIYRYPESVPLAGIQSLCFIPVFAFMA